MKSLSYLNKYFLKYKWRLFLGILFIIATNIFKVQLPIYTSNRYDQLVSLVGIPKAELIWKALEYGSGYIIIALISGVFLFLTRQTIIIMSRLIEYDLKNEIYQHFQETLVLFLI